MLLAHDHLRGSASFDAFLSVGVGVYLQEIVGSIVNLGLGVGGLQVGFVEVLVEQQDIIIGAISSLELVLVELFHIFFAVGLHTPVHHVCLIRLVV